MSAPNIDPRNRAAILAQLESLALAEVPDLTGKDLDAWRNHKDAAYALLQIFSYMADHTVTQLNKVPDKQLVAYLNVLGTKLLPPQPARTPINFILAQGTQENVDVPAGTQVSTDSKIIFETERPITATTAQLKAIITVDQKADEVYDNMGELDSAEKQTTLFASPAMQEHALYLGDDSLFNLKKGAGRRERKPSMRQLAKIEFTVEYADANQKGSLTSNVKWSYSYQDTQDAKVDWIDFTDVAVQSTDAASETITLTKTNSTPTAMKNVNGAVTFWIRAKVDPSLPKTLPALKSLSATLSNEIHPDAAFYNDVPINLAENFYPFGAQPNTADVFYISSREGFSKKNAKVQIQFDLQTSGVPGVLTDSSGSHSSPLQISWEYWDGKTWSNLKGIDYIFKDKTNPNANTPQVTFICPADIAETKVNNKENYWIRARIASGNYRSITVTDKPVINEQPPFTRDIKIQNLVNPHVVACQAKNVNQQVVTCQAKNNLQYQNWDNPSVAFQPFVPVEEPNQTLYMGFDSPLGKGTISVFFALRKQEYLDDKKPRIVWSYLRMTPKEEWVPIEVEDSTGNLTQSGAIEFLAPSDIGAKEKFGQTLYWIRGEVVENPFQSMGQTLANMVNAAVDTAGKSTKTRSRVETKFYRLNPQLLRIVQDYVADAQLAEYVQSSTASGQPCNKLDIYNVKFSVPNAIKEIPAAPIAFAVSLNSTLATQAETVTDELLGTSDGVMAAPLKLSRTPIVSVSLWVQETQVPADGDYTVNTSDPTKIWVQWRAVNDFFDSDENSRDYIVDRITGEITFGDGANGMIPTVASSIKATYQTGGGVNGNVGLGEVKKLITAIDNVNKAVNIDDAEGGADAETVERAKKRGPKIVQNRDRAVAQEDYEWLSIEASGDVARAKCIPNLNSEGQIESGCVAVIVIPESNEDQPTPSSRLLQTVEDYLKSHNPISVATLTVTEPTYLTVSVAADIFVANIDSASAVNFAALNALKTFLHPLHGGSDGKGWDFGKRPCDSDILALLQSIAQVDHVENLAVTVCEAQNGNVLPSDNNLVLPGYALICSGTHQLNVKLSGGS